MTKREYCLNHPAIARNWYLSTNACALWWECHGIEYGVDDAVYLSLHSNEGAVSYHRLRIYTTNGNDPKSYVMAGSTRLYLDDFIRI